VLFRSWVSCWREVFNAATSVHPAAAPLDEAGELAGVLVPELLLQAPATSVRVRVGTSARAEVRRDRRLRISLLLGRGPT
jgi:hypothetical protein